MKQPFFDRSLQRTVLFSLAVVFMVIGLYQTVLENSLPRNYWLFMLSVMCLLLYRYLGREQPAGTPPPAAPAKPKKKKPAGKARR